MKQLRLALWAYAVCGLAAVVLGLAVGSSGLEWDAAAVWVWELRAPRSAGAWLVGGLLGFAGALAQALFRNPLADPYLLGSASGAGLAYAVGLLALAGGGAADAAGGADFAVLAGLSAGVPLDVVAQWGLGGLAFVGAWLAVLLSLALARLRHGVHLLLSGVVVGMVLGALTSLLSVWQPALLPAMQGFMLGQTAFLQGSSCLLLACVWAFCALAALPLVAALNALGLGAETAQSLGFRMQRVQAGALLLLALATGVAVAQTGLIAFVGLAAGHMVRRSLPAGAGVGAWLALASLAGAALLAWADVLARWLMAPQELPVGVLTAILGGAYLLWVLRRGGTWA